jgi:hypothetical protein
MQYTLTPIHCRPWTLVGLSPKLIESHYENNYGGAVRRLNSVTEQLAALDPMKAPPALYNALKREELVALNSGLLHEARPQASWSKRSRAISARSTAGAPSSSPWATPWAADPAGSC